MTEPLMAFDAVLRREHFAEFSAASMKRFGRSRATTLQGIAYLVVVFVLTLAFMRLSDSVARPIDPKAWLAPRDVVVLALMTGMLVALLLGWLMSRTIRTGYAAGALREGGSYLGHRHFTLDEHGIRSQGAHGHGLTLWSAVIEMTQAPGTYLLWTDPGAAIMVPKDAFADESARAKFATVVAERISRPAETG